MATVYNTTGTGERAKFLRESGLEGEMIPVGDWNTLGYLRVHLNPGGDAKFYGGDPDRPVLEYKDWPRGFDYDKWLLLTAGERENV